jgi:hypothetical protein
MLICSYVMLGLFDMIGIGLRQLRETEDYKTYSILTACKLSDKSLRDFGAHPVRFVVR